MKKLFFVLAVCAYSIGNVYADWTYGSRSTSDMSVTLSTVTTRVRSLIDDPYTNYGTTRFSSATIQGFINDAQQRIFINVASNEAYAYQTLTAYTTEYALPKDCLYVERVILDKLDGKGESVLPQKTVWGLDDNDSTWTIKSSTPTAYYIRNRYIGMYPAPAYSTATLGIWYIKFPSRMTAETDYVFDGMVVMEPYWELLAIYAAAKLAQLEGNTNLYTSLVAEWSGGLKDMLGYLKYNPNYTPTNVMNDK